MPRKKRQEAANGAADEDGPGPSSAAEDPLTGVVYIGYELVVTCLLRPRP